MAGDEGGGNKLGHEGVGLPVEGVEADSEVAYSFLRDESVVGGDVIEEGEGFEDVEEELRGDLAGGSQTDLEVGVEEEELIATAEDLDIVAHEGAEPAPSCIGFRGLPGGPVCRLCGKGRRFLVRRLVDLEYGKLVGEVVDLWGRGRRRGGGVLPGVVDHVVGNMRVEGRHAERSGGIVMVSEVVVELVVEGGVIGGGGGESGDHEGNKASIPGHGGVGSVPADGVGGKEVAVPHDVDDGDGLADKVGRELEGVGVDVGDGAASNGHGGAGPRVGDVNGGHLEDGERGAA